MKSAIRVVAWIVVVLILPGEAAESEHCVRIEQARPSGRDIESSDFRALVLRAHRQTVRTQAAVIHYQARTMQWRFARRKNLASGTTSV